MTKGKRERERQQGQGRDVMLKTDGLEGETEETENPDEGEEGWNAT